MATNSRVRPLVHSSRVRPVRHSERVRPLEYEGAELDVIVSDTNHFGWITHPDNPAMTATVACTNASSVYPVSNLQVLPITAVWRSTDLTTQDMTFDLGSAHTIDILALVNHNLTSGATVSIAAGSTASYGDFSDSMTWREFTMFKYLSAAQSYRYWRIRIADASNPDGFIEVGYPVVGYLTKPGFTFRQGWISSPEFTNSKVVTEFGTPYVEEMFRQHRLDMQFGPLLESEAFLIRRLFTTIKKNVYPALILPVRGGSDAYFGRLRNLFEERVELLNYADLQFLEDGIGARVEA